MKTSRASLSRGDSDRPSTFLINSRMPTIPRLPFCSSIAIHNSGRVQHRLNSAASRAARARGAEEFVRFRRRSTLAQ